MAYPGQGQYEKAAEAFDREIQMHVAPADIPIWTIAAIGVAVVREIWRRKALGIYL